MNQRIINDYGLNFLLKYNVYLENMTPKQMKHTMLNSKDYKSENVKIHMNSIFKSYNFDEIIRTLYKNESFFELIKFKNFNYSKIELIDYISTLFSTKLEEISPNLTRALFLMFNKDIINIDPNLNEVLPNNIMNNGQNLEGLKINLGTLIFLTDYMDILPKSFSKDFSKYCENLNILLSNTERETNYIRYGL